MAELQFFNPFESFQRGQTQGAQNALMREAMQVRKQRPEMIRNALTSRDPSELFAQDPEMGAQVQTFLDNMNERERAEFQQKHEASARLVEWVESLPPEQRPKAWQRIVPEVSGLWGGAQALPANYDPTAAGMILAQARGISQSFGNMPADVQSFEMMTRGLSPEEKERARRVELGLEGRASGAGWKTFKATGRDGREYVINHNPRTGENVVVGGDEFVSPTERESAFETTAGAEEAKLQAEKEKARPKIRMALLRGQARIGRVESTIDNILPKVNLFTAGFAGSKMANTPGTPAHDLAKNLGTIKAIAGFDELQALRDSSPTGGALGQVSERELEFLQSVVANIENSQSPEQLRENLEIFRQASREAWANVRAAYEQDYGVTMPESGGQRGQGGGSRANPQTNDDPLSALTPEQREKYGL